MTCTAIKKKQNHQTLIVVFPSIQALLSILTSNEKKKKNNPPSDTTAKGKSEDFYHITVPFSAYPQDKKG